MSEENLPRGRRRSGGLRAWLWLLVPAGGFLLYMAVYCFTSDALAYYEDGELISSVRPAAVFGIALAVTLAEFVLLAAVTGGKTSQEKLFTALWLSLGLLYMIAQPVMSEADSRTHYYRSADVAEGRWVTERDEEGTAGGSFAIPEAWVDDGNSTRLSTYDSLEYLNYSVDETPTYFTYTNTAVYSPFTYLPQAIGIFLAGLFTDRLMLIVYAGRLTNFLITGLAYWMAVRLMPFSKKYVIWCALLPMNLHEAVSLAPDAMVSALTVLLMAACLRLRFDEKSRLTPGMIALLYIVSFLISQDKIVYVGAVLMLFLIPPEKFRSRRNYWFHVLLLGALVVLSSLGWLAIASQGLLGQYADSHGQLMVVLKQPWIFIAAILRSLLRRSSTYLNQMMGMYFGPFLVKNDMVLIYGVTAVFAAIPLIRFVRGRLAVRRESGAQLSVGRGKNAPFSAQDAAKEKTTVSSSSSGAGGEDSPETVRGDAAPRMDLRARLLLAASGAVTILLIFTSEYILWTNYLGRYVDGIQGRYFIPVIPLGLAAVFGLRKDDMEGEKLQYALLTGVNLCTALNAAVSWLYLTGSNVLF